MSEIHLEILDTNRQQIFHRLSEFSSFGYLAGGTALALQINHRKSFDFDIFVEKEIGNSLRQKIKIVFGDCQYEVNTSDQISFIGPNSISITFVWYYFPSLLPHIQTNSIPLSSIEDIAADKAMTIGRRAVWRDYVDMYFLLNFGYVDLPTMIGNAQKKFGNEFVETQFLEQVSYFGDVTIAPIEYIGNAINENDIKSYLTYQVKDFVNQQIERK